MGSVRRPLGIVEPSRYTTLSIAAFSSRLESNFLTPRETTCLRSFEEREAEFAGLRKSQVRQGSAREEEECLGRAQKCDVRGEACRRQDEQRRERSERRNE